MSLAFDLRLEDRLEGASNFIPWKERTTLLLEECDLCDIVKKVVPNPTYPTSFVDY